jgi:hypothetical protein
MGRVRALTLALLFSGSLNLALLIAFVVKEVRAKEANYAFAYPKEVKTVVEVTNSELLASYLKLSFKELAALLMNREGVEEGYTKRSLALAALVQAHEFDLERSLGASPEKRVIALPDGTGVELYPALGDDQYRAILQFLYTEKWPLTPKGLFERLSTRDESLEMAFRATPPFEALQVLFHKSGLETDPRTLVQLASEGSWEMLERFYSEQQQMLDWSKERRQRVLLSYLANRSPTAARLLVSHDYLFALKRLDDKGILDLVDLLEGAEKERLMRDLSVSARSDAVRKRLLPMKEESKPLPISNAEHVVKEGENLWRISRQYKISVDELVRANHLEKERLKPGMILKVPHRVPPDGKGGNGAAAAK